jgi:hypothetical protein
MTIFVLFRPKTKKTRFLTDYQKRTRKGQGKDKERTKRTERTRKGPNRTRKGPNRTRKGQ